MEYMWNPSVQILEKSDEFLFINPARNSWLKAGPEVKGLLDHSVAGQEFTEEVPEEIVERILGQFARAGMILPKGQEVEASHEMSRTDYIKTIYFFVTRKCNLACDFCSMESHPQVVEEGLLSKSQIQQMVTDLSQHPVRTVVISGGEPLLRDDLVEVIGMVKDQLGSKVFLASNGLLLTDELLDQLEGKVDRIDLSLENIFEPGAEWQEKKLLSLLEELQRRQIPRGVSFVMTKENWQHVFDFIDIAVKYDAATSIKIAAPLGMGRVNQDLLMSADEIMETYQKIFAYIHEQRYDQPNIQELVYFRLTPEYSCSAKGKILNIYPDGQVYSCHSLNAPEFSLGNMLQDGIEQVLSNQEQKACSPRYQELFDIDQRTECQDCGIRHFCLGSCMAEVYYNQFRQGQLPPECGIKKLLISNILWDWDDEKDFLANLEVLIAKMSMNQLK